MLCYFSESSSQIIYFPSFWKVVTSSLFQLTSYFCLISILLEGGTWLLGWSLYSQLACSFSWLLTSTLFPSCTWLLCDHSIPNGAIASSSNCHYLWFTLAPLGFHRRKCVFLFLINDITSEICVFTPDWRLSNYIQGFTLISYMFACSVITV